MTFSVEYDSDAFLRWDNSREEFEVTRGLPVLWKVDGIVHADFVVKAGFYSDLASIPQWATSFIPKLGHHVRPAIVHDWTYRMLGHENLSRTQADLLFLHGMEKDGVLAVRRTIIYRAVRFGGEGDFKSKRKEITKDDKFETVADS